METPKTEYKCTPRRGTDTKLRSESYLKKNMPTPRSKFKVFSQGLDDVRKIIVAVRIRPMNSKELILGGSCPFDIIDKEIAVNSHSSDIIASGLVTTFSYDNIFWSSKDHFHKFSSQKHVFDEIGLPLLDAALEGYNACLFAYGQTGSGKSYSMMGCDNTLCGEGAGIIPRFCNELFSRNHGSALKFKISVSYYEIYNEKIHDLLSTSFEIESKTSLRVREHPTTGPYVENLSKHDVESLEILNTLLALGNSRRATSATIHNNHSSRSHAILEICIFSKSSGQLVHSKVSLVDLAGSERISHPSITEERFKEGLSINKSLLTLGKVITSLSDLKKGAFVPYRESVLTWLLKESLGGNSRTVMLATVSPSVLAIEETLSTLRYACQARHILNRVAVNEDPQLKVIRELREEIERLKSLHDHKKNEKVKYEESNALTKHLIKTNYIKYENELLNIEIAQKAVEDQLHTELSRIGLNLEVAEKRRSELESQKDAFFNKIKTNQVSIYQSDFYENLQNILNNSNSNISQPFCFTTDDNEVLLNLRQLEECLKKLKKSVASNKENNSPIKHIQPLVEYMDKCYQDICEILDPHL